MLIREINKPTSNYMVIEESNPIKILETEENVL